MADDAQKPTGQGANPNPANSKQSAADQAAADALKAAQSAIAGLASDSAAASAPKSAADQMASDALKAAQDAISGLAGIDANAPAASANADNVFEDAMKAAMEEEAALKAASKIPAGATPMSLPALTANLSPAQQKAIDLLSDVNLNVKIELGRTRMLVEDVLKLGEGAVVELDKLAGDPVDIYVNDRHVARGEVLVLNDSFCVRVSEILQQVGETTAAVAKAV